MPFAHDTFPGAARRDPDFTNGGFGARWNPQGGEVFYRSPAGKLMAVSLKMDKNSAVETNVRELFTLPVTTEESSTRIDHELAGVGEIEQK